MRRPLTITGEIRMKWSRFPGAHGTRPTCSRRRISAPSITAREFPAMVTLQPVCVAMSTLSASKATTALRVAAASLPPESVLMMMSPPPSSVKSTSSTAGSACRV
jgi:hypothetical protein